MSLINQMLSDLDQRRSATTPAQPFITSTNQSHNIHSRNLFFKISFLIIILVSLGITAYYSYQIYSQHSQNNSAQVPATIKNNTELTNAQIKPPKYIPIQSKHTQINLPKPTVQVALPIKKTVKTTTAPKQKSIQQATSVAPIIENTIEEDFVTDIQSVKKQTLSLNPKQQAEISYKKGYALLKQNKIYSAESKLLLALEHNVKHIKAREMLTGLYLKTGRKVEAQETLTKGLLHLPSYTNFTKLLARLLLDKNQINKAITLLLQHKPSISSDPNYYALLAASYQRNKNHNAAARTYVELLKLKPREGIWWVGMAISLEALNKNKDAFNAYEKARQTGTLNTRISNYSSQRLKHLNLDSIPSEQE